AGGGCGGARAKAYSMVGPGPESSAPSPPAVSITAAAMNSASNIGISFRTRGGREILPPAVACPVLRSLGRGDVAVAAVGPHRRLGAECSERQQDGQCNALHNLTSPLTT